MGSCASTPPVEAPPPVRRVPRGVHQIDASLSLTERRRGQGGNDDTERKIVGEGALPSNNNEWDRDAAPITMTSLQRERDKFWDTRVEGRPEVWCGLKLALEAKDDDTRALILDGIGVSNFRTNSTSTFYVWDQRGVKYVMPMYLIYAPRSLVTAEQAADIQLKKEKARLEAKTKAMGDKGQDEGGGPIIQFTIRCSNGKDLKVEAPIKTTMKDVKKIVQHKYSVKLVRQHVLHCGHIRADATTLADLAIGNGGIVQVFLIPDDIPLAA